MKKIGQKEHTLKVKKTFAIIAAICFIIIVISFSNEYYNLGSFSFWSFLISLFLFGHFSGIYKKMDIEKENAKYKTYSAEILTECKQCHEKCSEDFINKTNKENPEKHSNEETSSQSLKEDKMDAFFASPTGKIVGWIISISIMSGVAVFLYNKMMNYPLNSSRNYSVSCEDLIRSNAPTEQIESCLDIEAMEDAYYSENMLLP